MEVLSVRKLEKARPPVAEGSRKLMGGRGGRKFWLKKTGKKWVYDGAWKKGDSTPGKPAEKEKPKIVVKTPDRYRRRKLHDFFAAFGQYDDLWGEGTKEDRESNWERAALFNPSRRSTARVRNEMQQSQYELVPIKGKLLDDLATAKIELEKRDLNTSEYRAASNLVETALRWGEVPRMLEKVLSDRLQMHQPERRIKWGDSTTLLEEDRQAFREAAAFDRRFKGEVLISAEASTRSGFHIRQSAWLDAAEKGSTPLKTLKDLENNFGRVSVSESDAKTAGEIAEKVRKRNERKTPRGSSRYHWGGDDAVGPYWVDEARAKALEAVAEKGEIPQEFTPWFTKEINNETERIQRIQEWEDSLKVKLEVLPGKPDTFEMRLTPRDSEEALRVPVPAKMIKGWLRDKEGHLFVVHRAVNDLDAAMAGDMRKGWYPRQWDVSEVSSGFRVMSGYMIDPGETIKAATPIEDVVPMVEDSLIRMRLNQEKMSAAIRKTVEKDLGGVSWNPGAELQARSTAPTEDQGVQREVPKEFRRWMESQIQEEQERKA